MASPETNSPGTAENDASVGTIAWTNASNITASDDSRATFSGSGSGVISNYLKATNFGFAIPAGATIDGIVVEFERRRSAGTSVVDSAVRIVKGGTIGSTNKSAGAGWVAEAYASFGGEADLWDETWTADDINASTFGAVISASGTGMPFAGDVDHVRITVHYTAAAVRGMNRRGRMTRIGRSLRRAA